MSQDPLRGGESTVKIDCEEIAMKSMARSNKISVAALHQAASKQGSAGQKLLTRLATIDRNGDGELDAIEVIALLNDKADLRRDKRRLIWAGAVALVLVLFLCAIIVGLTAVVVIKVKDTEVSNTNNYYIMKAKGTDQTIQVANEDMKVVGGTLMTRNSQPGRQQVLGTSTRRIGWLPTGALSQAALLSIRTIGIFPTPRTFMHVNVVGTMALPADNITPNASYVFFTHMGAIRLSQDTRMLLNSEVLDYLEQRRIPTCRNPTGNGTVLSNAPLCDIMPPKATSRRRLLESWSELSGDGHGYSVHDDSEDIMHLGMAI